VKKQETSDDKNKKMEIYYVIFFRKTIVVFIKITLMYE